MPKSKTPKPDKLAPMREEARRVLHAALALEAQPAHPDTAFAAQDLFYGAMELRRPEAVLRRCIKAVQINPNAPDPLSSLAEFVGGSSKEQIAVYRKIVAAGERDLGKQAFKKLEGDFWGFIETRPYMRARHKLAMVLTAAGQLEDAAREYQEMLRLNPNDNQGVRYSLLGLYLQLGWLQPARKLWQQYAEEYSAFWAWGRVLLEVLSKDELAATQVLEQARKVNAYAEAYLGGWKPLPKDLPPYYAPGDETEGIVCAVEIGAAWKAHPGAMHWLEQQK